MLPCGTSFTSRGNIFNTKIVRFGCLEVLVEKGARNIGKVKQTALPNRNHSVTNEIFLTDVGQGVPVTHSVS